MASKEWREWHLTKTGWIAGTFKHDNGYIEALPPADRVMTCIYKETIEPKEGVYSGFGDFGFTKSEEINIVWRSSDENLVSDLLEKFGSCPEKLEAN